VIAGCGSSHSPTPRSLALERADLVAATRALREVEPSVGSEVAATKAAWPHVLLGLPPHIGARARSSILTAGQRARALKLPALLTEKTSASLTGPASELAGTYRSFALLAERGWKLIGASVAQSEHGPTVAARFARANAALYIESVYDAHFSLAQVGKQLVKAYDKLGGTAAFGASLTPAEVATLADTYSEPNLRLQPHALVKLGS
jgi:hypothetical protein